MVLLSLFVVVAVVVVVVVAVVTVDIVVSFAVVAKLSPAQSNSNSVGWAELHYFCFIQPPTRPPTHLPAGIVDFGCVKTIQAYFTST